MFIILLFYFSFTPKEQYPGSQKQTKAFDIRRCVLRWGLECQQFRWGFPYEVGVSYIRWGFQPPSGL